ncbi:MAG: hypothetical protein JKY67_08715 [Pseudomonadales bacterium]|nr:hypothetical protein [Pseudomonadales bacterium]
MQYGNLFDYLADHTFEELLAGFGMQIEGTVSALDTGAKQFNIGLVPVSYTDAIFDGMVEGDLANDLVVKVDSQLDFDGSGTLTATKIALGSGDGSFGFDLSFDYSNFNYSLDGVVTVDADGSSIVINGQLITINASTTFNNVDLASLVEGTSVNCVGYVNDLGDFIAESITVEYSADSTLTGAIESITVDGTNAGSITIAGVTYKITTKTVMDDDSATPLEHFNVTFLSTADVVIISYYTDPTTFELVITKLERD